MTKKTKEKADGGSLGPDVASSASSGALFKEDIPRSMRVEGKIETAISEDDTLMGRLAKRMASRDLIDSMNFGPFDKDAKKANTADQSFPTLPIIGEYGITDIDIPRPVGFEGPAMKKGIEVEKEHTDDPKKAAKIATDHLKESPNYYKDWKDKEKILFQKKAPEITGPGRHEHSSSTISSTNDVSPLVTESRKGNTMKDQAENAGNVIDTRKRAILDLDPRMTQ